MAKTKRKRVTAKDIQKLLAERHSEDVYVEECKGGSTWGGSERMDGWAMKKSWANPRLVGYEIKVKRTDFLRDDKWTNYLPYCNQLYFVCPHSEIIRASECPEQAGLIYISSTGNKLYTKKKAPIRQEDPAMVASLMKYLLMSRIEIVSSTFNRRTPEGNLAYWTRWLEDKFERHELGYRVRGEIRRRYDELENKTIRENSQLENENESLQEIKKFCRDLGINPRGYISKHQIEAALFGSMNKVCRSAKGTITVLKNMVEIIEAKKAEHEDPDGV